MYVVMLLIYVVSVGEGHLKTRGDGGDCNVDATEALGTGGLKSPKPCHKSKSHQASCGPDH